MEVGMTFGSDAIGFKADVKTSFSHSQAETVSNMQSTSQGLQVSGECSANPNGDFPSSLFQWIVKSKDGGEAKFPHFACTYSTGSAQPPQPQCPVGFCKLPYAQTSCQSCNDAWKKQ